MSSLFDFTPAQGPPIRKGDKGVGSSVDAMKTGLRAYYAKKGQPVKERKMDALYEAASVMERETCPSPTKDALKTGLRAWYRKRKLKETTTQANVGAELPARALGEPRKKNLPKGGTSLRADIQRLENALEGTLLTLSNKGYLSDDANHEFRASLAEALMKALVDGDLDRMKDIKMQASVIESRFIGKMEQDGETTLTLGNDLGTIFRAAMGGLDEAGPIVDMVTNQLSSGTPLTVVKNNVTAALASTTDSGNRTVLDKAFKVLSGIGK